jgi:putative transposase
MARLARVTVIGFPHAVSQHGNRDKDVFEEDVDYRRYLGWLQEYAARYAVDIWAYCLMPNWVQFVCLPKEERALARAFNTLHMRYAQYFNGKRAVRGQLWKDRFRSCVLDDPSVFEEIRFVETSPVRAGIVELAEDYPWSSARCHVIGEPDPLLIPGSDAGRALNRTAGVTLYRAIPAWRSYLAAAGNETIIKRTRERLKTGRPAGDAEFVRTLEGKVGRRLGARPVGRPRKGGAAAKSG